MSENNNLELNININANQSEFDKLKRNLDEVDQKWNRLASLPPLDIDRKIGSGFSQEQLNILNRLGGPSRTGGVAPSGTIEDGDIYSPEQRAILNGMGGPVPWYRPTPGAPGPGYTGSARGASAPDYPGMAHSSLSASYFHPAPNVGDLMARSQGNNGLSLVRAMGPAYDIPFSGGGSSAGPTSAPPLSYTWDSVYQKELAKIQDPDKRSRFLSMMDETAYKGMMYDPASTTGKYHPLSANKEGGLALHSMTVARAAREFAVEKGYTGDLDDLTIAGLAHDSVKKKNGFYNSKHDEEAAANAREYGLYAASEMMATHMYMGKKGQAEPITEGQKILHEADWLASRKYAEDYMQGKEGYGALRDRAIKAGDATMGKDGFLKILSAEANKDQKEVTDNAKKLERSWNSILDSAGKYGQLLKGLGALGIAAVTAGIVATTANNKDMGSGLQTFTGLDGNDIMANQIAAAKIGIGESSINDAVIAMAKGRGGFQLKGEGELLNKALWGQINSMLVKNEIPANDVFWQIADKVADDVKGMKPADREKQLNLAATNIPGMEYVVDFMLRMSKDGKDYRSKDMLTNTLREGGSASWMTEAARVNAAMQIEIAGIKDSFKGLAQAFQDLFGQPVLSFFNKALDEFVNGKDGQRGMADMMAQYKGNMIIGTNMDRLGLSPAWNESGSMYRSFERSTIAQHDKLYAETYAPLAEAAGRAKALKNAQERDRIGVMGNLDNYDNISASELDAAWTASGGGKPRPYGMGYSKEDTERRTALERTLKMQKIRAAAADKGLVLTGNTPEELIADGKRQAKEMRDAIERTYKDALDKAKVTAESAADLSEPYADEIEGLGGYSTLNIEQKYRYSKLGLEAAAKRDSGLAGVLKAVNSITTPTEQAKIIIPSLLDKLMADPSTKDDVIKFILDSASVLNNNVEYLDKLPTLKGKEGAMLDKGNVYISASFPNVTSSKEIQSAFTDISSNAMNGLYTRSVG